MLKKFFTAGLLLWIPLACTLWLIESLIRWGDALLLWLPKEWHPNTLVGVEIPGIGLLLAAAIIFITGLFRANFIGAKLVHLWERFLHHIPLIRPIYSGIKQIAQTFLSEQKHSFKDVVLIEYPQANQWTFAFVVSDADTEARQRLKRDLITVFVPTAPNPTSGYVLMVPRDSVKETSFTVDEALKFHVSLGVITPVKGEQNVDNIQNKRPKDALSR